MEEMSVLEAAEQINSINRILQSALDKNPHNPLITWNALRHACESYDWIHLEYMKKKGKYLEMVLDREKVDKAKEEEGMVATDITEEVPNVSKKKVQKKKSQTKKIEKKRKALPFAFRLSKFVKMRFKNVVKLGEKTKKIRMAKKTLEANGGERAEFDVLEITKAVAQKWETYLGEQKEKLLKMMKIHNPETNKSVTVMTAGDVSCAQKYRDWMNIILSPAMGASPNAYSKAVINERSILLKVGVKEPLTKEAAVGKKAKQD